MSWDENPHSASKDRHESKPTYDRNFLGLNPKQIFLICYFSCFKEGILSKTKSMDLVYGSMNPKLSDFTKLSEFVVIDRVGEVGESIRYKGSSSNTLPIDRVYVSADTTPMFQSMPIRTMADPVSDSEAALVATWIRENLYQYYAFLTRGFSGSQAKLTMPTCLVSKLGLDFLANVELSLDQQGFHDVEFRGDQTIKFPKISFPDWVRYYENIWNEDNLKKYISSLTVDSGIGDQMMWQCLWIENIPIFSTGATNLSYDEMVDQIDSGISDDEILYLISYSQATYDESEVLLSRNKLQAQGYIFWNDFKFFVAGDIWPLSLREDNKLPKIMFEYQEPRQLFYGLISNSFSHASYHPINYFELSATLAASYVHGELISKMLVGLDDEWRAYQNSKPLEKRLTISVEKFQSAFMGSGAVYSSWMDHWIGSKLDGVCNGYIHEGLSLDMTSSSSYYMPRIQGTTVMAHGPWGPTPRFNIFGSYGALIEPILRALGANYDYETSSFDMNEAGYWAQMHKMAYTNKVLISIIFEFALFAYGHENIAKVIQGSDRLNLVYKAPDDAVFDDDKHMYIGEDIYYKVGHGYIAGGTYEVFRETQNIEPFFPDTLQYAGGSTGTSSQTQISLIPWHLEVLGRARHLYGTFLQRPDNIGMDSSSKLMRIQSSLADSMANVQTKIRIVDNSIYSITSRLTIIEDTLADVVRITSDFPAKQDLVIAQLNEINPILEQAVVDLLKIVELAEGTSGLETISNLVHNVKESVSTHYEVSMEETRRLSRVLTFLGDSLEGDLTSIPVMLVNEVDRLKIVIDTLRDELQEQIKNLPTKKDANQATAVNMLTAAVLRM